MPFEKTKDAILKTFNVSISTSCIQKNAEAIGEDISKKELNYIPSDFTEDCDRVYISIDGTGVPTVEGQCREAKTIVIEKIKDNKIKKWYGSKISKIDDFKNYIESVSLGLCINKCETIVILGDGAGWIDGIKYDLFPRSVRIIDFFHAAEYIHKGCEIIYGKESVLVKEKSEYLVEMLREGEVLEVINELKKRSKHLKSKKEIEKVINYFSNHNEDMDYENYEIKNGFKIGSGVVEGACKYVVGVRFKRNGMRWTVKDANFILSLRSLILNNRLEYYFKTRFGKIA
jgi:hypothetical protein